MENVTRRVSAERRTLTRTNSSRTERELAIVYRPIEQVELSAHNARLHDKTQVQQLARSIEAFGFNVSILVDAPRLPFCIWPVVQRNGEGADQ